MNIGEPRRAIEVEPVETPVPDALPIDVPDPAPAEPAPAAEPVRTPALDGSRSGA